jgi:hypothetical protein
VLVVLLLKIFLSIRGSSQGSHGNFKFLTATRTDRNYGSTGKPFDRLKAWFFHAPQFPTDGETNLVCEKQTEPLSQIAFSTALFGFCGKQDTSFLGGTYDGKAKCDSVWNR